MTTDAPTTDAKLHGIFAALLNGELERGKGGVLYVRDDMCAYRFPREFSDATFRGHVEKLLADDEGDPSGGHFFVAKHEEGNQMRIFGYTKAHVHGQALRAAREQSKARDEAQHPRIEEVD